MEDLSQKINDLLSDPSMMEQIKNLAGLLGQSENNSKPAEAAAPPPSPPPSNNNPLNPEILSTVMKIAPLLQSVNQEDDSTRLLRALRPFLSDEKCHRLDEAIKMLGLFKMLPLMKSMGFDLLKRGGDSY